MADIDNIRIAVRLLDQQFKEAIEDLKSELRQLETRIESVDSKSIDLHTDVAWRREFAELQRAIATMESQDIDLDVDVSELDIAGAVAASQGARAGGPAMGSGQISRGLATGNLSEMNLAMSDVHNALARLIPVLFVFIGALPAAITAIATLATAAVAAAASLAAIGGLGLMGFAMAQEEGGGIPSAESFMAAFEEIRDSFFEAFAPLAQRLAPLFEDALNGLGRLFQAIADQGDALMALTDEARAFGGFVMNFIPQFLRAMAGLVEMVSPVFGQIADFIQSNQITRAFVAITHEALPALQALTEQLLLLLPGLMRASVGFLRVSAAVFGVFNAIGKLLSFLPITAEQLGVIIGSALTLASAFFILNSAIVSAAVSALSRFVPSMVAFHASMLTSATSVSAFTSALYGLATSIFTVRNAVMALMATTGIGLLISLTGQIAGGFVNMSAGIDEAATSLKEFDRIASGMGGENPYGAPGLDGSGSTAIGGSVNVTINGDADADEFRRRADSLLYSMQTQQ